ncbi:rod shape-determining protein RodA [Thermithiobacillus tepidarius DSM 3134]|uniref:rod shape-determining protein RodA n=1 Tax=Thermithiobacillus tepidarius TaxID=929 RepID=UPI00040C076B|nr:rod shape-determining protein RodA [Thermithiobacillus tepidarius]
MIRVRSFFGSLDLGLVALVLMLMVISLLSLYSASGKDAGVVVQQLIRYGLSLAVILVIARIPPRLLYAWAPYLYFGTLVLLIMVALAGEIRLGARRWLDLGFFSFQPSELMKIALPMFLARYYAQENAPLAVKPVLAGLVIIAVPFLLVLRQPDLGTATLIASAGFFVLWLAGTPMRWFLGMGAALAASAPVLWHFLHDYQRQRILTLLDPQADPLGAGYHIIQSMIAIGSGGSLGKGWLQGTQAHLDFIPESHTDFIFAVFAEEFGLLGEIVLLSLYLLVIGRGLIIAFENRDPFARLLAGALSLTLFIYVFANMGMTSGILPVVGVPLPFISYGGTSMLTLMTALGILMSVHAHRRVHS